MKKTLFAIMFVVAFIPAFYRIHSVQANEQQRLNLAYPTMVWPNDAQGIAAQEQYEKQQKAEKAEHFRNGILFWQRIDGIGPETYRAALPEGWLVLVGDEAAPVFVPDVEHHWELGNYQYWMSEQQAANAEVPK